MQRHVAIHYFKFEFPQKPLCGTNHHLQRFGLEAEISETNFKTSLSSISLFHKTDKRGLVGHVDEKKKKKLLCIQSAVELRLGESGAAGRRVNAATQPGSCRTDSLCSHSASIQKEIKTRWRWRSREKYLAENIRCTVYASSESSLWSQIMI